MNAEQYARVVGVLDLVKKDLGDVAVSDTDAALVAMLFWAEQHGNAQPKSPYQIAIREEDGRGFVTARGEEIEIAPESLEKARCDAQVVSADIRVRACRKIVSTTVRTSGVATTHSILTLGRR